ncbi:MAG: hypothetical protein VKS61_04710 [Candidatus Sericytochromatia bacterium]|nr:hypothetical protein [Candidatus Sericytochromatia bacterium]MEB3221359.1 hypothetical protein [Candidatus Sericytochromatia bacterium]
MGIHRVGSIQQLPGRPPVAAPVAPPAQPAAAAWGQDGASFGGVPPYATPPFVPQQPSPWGQTPPYPGVPQQPSPWGQTPPYPSVPQQPTSPWGQTPSYPSVPQQPSPWGQTPPVAPGPTPAQVAEIQALMAEVARLQQQLDAILAMRPQPAPGWGTQPAGPTPGWGMQPTTPAFPMSVPPAPLPQAPLPVAPPLPAPPPVAPPLPAPPPVIPPAQTTPAPTPPSPTPPPVIPAPSQPTTARPGLLQLSGLPAGTRLRLAPGTSVKGFDVSGTAAIRESSPQVLDLIAKGSALFGLVRRTYGLRAEAQPDGRMKIALNEIGSDGRAKKSVFSGNLKVLDSRPGSLTLRDPDGKAGSITQGADGSLTIQHPEGTIKLYVTGRAPLIAGVDDVDNGQALA